MYTLDIKKEKREKREKIVKTILAYIMLSVIAVIVDNIYAMFGHGVRSAFMSFMFLYPLLGGALGYFILWLTAPGVYSGRWYRFGYNLYNSGIAALTVGSFFKGILDIAGTESDYSRLFFLLGWVLMAAGAGFLIFSYKFHTPVTQTSYFRDIIKP